MLADIAITNRAEQRIGQRMEQDIRIGMAQQLAMMRNGNAAEPDMIACREGMDIIAEAGPDFRDRRQMALGADEIFLCNSSWGIMPVVGIEGATVGGGAPGAMTRTLREALSQALDGETRDSAERLGGAVGS